MKDNRSLKRMIERECVDLIRPAIIVEGVQDLLSSALPAATAFLVGDMADHLLNLNVSAILKSLPLFLTALLLNVFAVPAIELIRNLFLTKYGIQYDIHLMKRLIRTPVLQIQKTESGAVTERLSEDSASYCFNQVFKWSQPPVILLYFGALIGTLLSGGWNPYFSFALFLSAAFPVLRTELTGKKEAILRRRESEYEETRKTQEYSLHQSREFIKGYGMETSVVQVLRELYTTYLAQYGKKKIALESRNTLIDYICGYGAQTCVIMLGAILISFGFLTPGELLSGYLLLPSIQKCYGYMSQFIDSRKSEQENIKRLKLFYGMQELEEELEPLQSQEIRLEDISFSYGEEEILSHLSFDMKKGDRIWLQGENGSGKSTLLNILNGLYPPSFGRILDEGGNVLSETKLRETVSLAEQGDAVFSGTVFDNLFLPPGREEEAEQILNRLGFIKGLDCPIEADGKNLSPGERKKLCLTRALLKKSSFLALDEPTNHLDSEGMNALRSILEERNQGLIIITHDACFANQIGLKRKLICNTKTYR